MNRTIKQWANCDPKAMAVNQSEAARYFAFKDAKSDILNLHRKNQIMLCALESALKTVELEKHPTRPWHDQARAAIAAAKGE